MEGNFGKKVIRYLDTAVQETQSCEQTQQIQVPDGMPDIGSIIAAWGQCVLRGKEWRSREVSVSAGMMVWVLYAPEDGSQEQCLEAWIPFQMKWELPEDTPEGDIRVKLLTRFVDARPVSARKILVRAGAGAAVSALVPGEIEASGQEMGPEGMELLKSTYPVRLRKEAGEKAFLMDEELALPDSAPIPEKLICYRMEPKVTDRKVLADKVVFRGNGMLHVLYRSEEGQLHGWDFEVPFSQYAALGGEHGGDAQAEFWLTPTGVELELDGEGHMRLKCGVTAQYLITDREMLEIIEDAYSPGRQLQLQKAELEAPVVLENRRENLYGEQTIPAEANLAVDVNYLPDFLRQRRLEDGVEVEAPGTVQVLYYGADGKLHSGMARVEGRQKLNADENSVITAIPMAGEAQAVPGSGSIQVKTELPVELSAAANQRIPMITGAQLGAVIPPDPARPSLILRRAGEKRLWDLAKASGTTVEAIRSANGLTGEPDPGRMLLIPVS